MSDRPDVIECLGRIAEALESIALRTAAQRVRVDHVERKGERYAYVCEDGYVRWADECTAYLEERSA